MAAASPLSIFAKKPASANRNCAASIPAKPALLAALDGESAQPAVVAVENLPLAVETENPTSLVEYNVME
jgi:hypothetical protein